MIDVKDVSLTINKQKILEHISFRVEQGEAVGLIGGNGSGKTMMMKCICGFDTSFTGEICVLDKRIGKDTEFPPRTGFIIETPGFIPYISGYENLNILANINKKIGREEICSFMELVGLDPLNRKAVRKYSLGMRQRLGIAQALMENPDVLILDEPFNGLDKKMIVKMREVLVQEKQQGKTILMTSHNERDIEYICDRTYEMDDGKINSE